MRRSDSFCETENRKNLELYLHIPFCVRKCSYCDFLSMAADENIRRQYVDMLLAELREKGRFCREYRVSTVFFGGGTPSLLAGVQIAELMEKNELFQTEADEIYMCLNCGHIYTGKKVPETCPVCKHDRGYYIRIDMAPFTRGTCLCK